MQERDKFPSIAKPDPVPWFDHVMNHLDDEQQRIILVRMLDNSIREHEQMPEIYRMARNMLKEEHNIDE